MSRSFCQAPTIFLCCLLVILTSTPASFAQTGPAPWEHGTHAFRLAMNNLGYQPLQSIDQCGDHPENKIIIVLGETSLKSPPQGVLGFVERGGAVLIATDRSFARRLAAGNVWEEHFGVTIGDSPVMVMDDDVNAYRGLQECPILRPKDNQDSLLFRGIRQGVATNRPTYLDVGMPKKGAQLSTMANYPEGCWSRDGLPMKPQVTPFAAGRVWGNGRILILADHSVYINEMMLQTDNDNITFAYNVLAWLGEGKRREVLFLEEGKVNSAFDIPMIDPPIPPPGPWINDLIQGVEEENLFNRAILQNIRLSHILRGLLIALTVGLLLYGLVRLVKARHRVDTNALPLAQAVNRQLSLQMVLQQRHQDMLRNDNLFEAARTLAQQCFTMVPAALTHHPMPRISAQGGWWERRRLLRQVRNLWQLAFGAFPRKVGAIEFMQLVREMETVQQALSRGMVRITP